MPELPEVETSRRGIEPYLVEKEIIRSIVRQPKLRWPISSQILALENQFVLAVQRRAKYILIKLRTGWILIHLGMSGSLRILPAFLPAAKHDHIDLILSSGMMLRYTDPRRFGSLLWIDDILTCSLLANLGPEPLSNEFNSQYLYQKSRNKYLLIKPWLMNNKIVVGIGNIYASEALFRAGILPQRCIDSLTKEECDKLVLTVKQVLTHSIEKGGTTLKDFLHEDGHPGYFAQELQVYGRSNKHCLICGECIELEKIAQRSTYFCRNCQH